MKLLFKIIFLLFAFSILLNNSFCQQIQFTHTWFSSGDHAAGQFIEMPDSTFYLVGYSGPLYGQGNYYEPFLMDINKYGDTLWTRSYDSTGASFNGLAPFNDSSFMVSGALYTSSTQPHYSFVKMNLVGDTLWKKSYAYPLSSSCPSYAGLTHQCPDGGYVAFSNEACDYGIMKIDSGGNLQWHHPHNMSEFCLEIKPDPFGGYVSVGGGGGVLKSYGVARLDSGGNEIWHHSYGNNIWGNDFYAEDVIIMPDSNYMVGTNGWDWQLMKLDRNTGDTIWTKFTNQIYAMDYASDNKVICITPYYLMLVDSAGNTVWQKTLPFIPNNAYWDVHKLMDGGYAYCGYLEYTGPQRRIIAFVKTDSLGNALFTSVYDPENNYQPLLFYPNPVQNELFISTGAFATENKLTFSLYDLQGREILHQLYNKSDAVDLTSVPDGVYIAVFER